MGTDRIRQIISAACAQEQHTPLLRQSFEEKLSRLRRELLLPEQSAAEALVDFVEQYIAYIPEFIETLAQRADDLTLGDSVAPFLHMAEDFFLAPPQELEADTGLEPLLDEAFLAQRLIEEVNDRYIALHRTPLLPVDMTRANIIVHHLIGDQLANRLNALVEHSVNLLIDRDRLFQRFDTSLDTNTSLLPLWQGLPCLSRNASIDLRL